MEANKTDTQTPHNYVDGAFTYKPAHSEPDSREQTAKEGDYQCSSRSNCFLCA